jgi:hypothetical protein
MRTSGDCWKPHAAARRTAPASAFPLCGTLIAPTIRKPGDSQLTVRLGFSEPGPLFWEELGLVKPVYD